MVATMPAPILPVPVPQAGLDIEDIDFVSLVRRGDNPDAHIVLAKSARNPDIAGGQPIVVGMNNNGNTPGRPGVALAGLSPDVEAFIKALQEQNELLGENLTEARSANVLLGKALDQLDEDDDEGFEDEDDEHVVKSDEDDDDPEDEDEDGDDESVSKAFVAQASELFAKQAAEIEMLREAQGVALAKAAAAETAYLGEQFSKRASALSAFGPPEDIDAATLLRKVYEQCDVDTYVSLEKWLFGAAGRLAENDEFGKELGYADHGDQPLSKFEQLMAKTGAGNQGDFNKLFGGPTAEQIRVQAMFNDPSIYAELNGISTRGR